MADRTSSAEQNSLGDRLGTSGLLYRYSMRKIQVVPTTTKQISHVVPPFYWFPCMCIHTAANNLADLVHINAVSCASTRASCSRFGRVSFGVEQTCPPAECGREPADAHSVPVPYYRDFSMPGIAILPGTFLFHKVLTTCQTLGIVKDTVCTLLGLTRHYRYVGQTGS
jgi:hypothetical protein